MFCRAADLHYCFALEATIASGRYMSRYRLLVFVAIVRHRESVLWRIGQAYRLPELQWQPERLPYNLEARQKRQA